MFAADPPDLFVASVLGVEDCVGEGRTREEAIAKAKAALVDRLARGEIITIDVENGSSRVIDLCG